MASVPRRRKAKGIGRAVARGKRVFLRYPQEADRDEFVGLLEASKAFHRPWEPRIPGGPHHRLDHILQARARSNSLKHVICRTSDGASEGRSTLISSVARRESR